MSQKAATEQRLEVIRGGAPSLIEIAKRAVVDSKEQKAAAKIAEQEKVKASLQRISAISAEIKQAANYVASLNKADREVAESELAHTKNELVSEKAELLNDPGVQIEHIKGLVTEFQNCGRWDQLHDIVEAAYSRGWFSELPKNARGNINYRVLKCPEVDNPKLREAMECLLESVIQAVLCVVEKSKQFKAQQKSATKGFVNKPKIKGGAKDKKK